MLIAIVSAVCVWAAHNSFIQSASVASTVNLRVIVSAKKTPHIIELIAEHLGANVRLLRHMSGGASVVQVHAVTAAPDDIVKAIAAIPQVEHAQLDAPVKSFAIPDDPRYPLQWQLHSNSKHYAALQVDAAWAITIGSADTVVAIIDTGVDYSHPDLSGRVLPGYDFVSPLSQAVASRYAVPAEYEYLRSNDGDGRDADASDPGNAVNQAIQDTFAGLDIECSVTPSSWHGTAVASVIAANTNDATGIAGIDQRALILPVRAIGTCGGRRSDLLDAIRWAAGVDDPALPPNPHPARIINLSLGVEDLCTHADQAAINDARAAGAIIVAAVGNNGRHSDSQPSSPSHCQNVLGVMAVDKNGYRASYSNIGRDADIAAPGGDLLPSLHSIQVATNVGIRTPQPFHSYRQATGTSIAAPHVAGVLALMLSLNPDIANDELEALLLESARAFPQQQSDIACNRTDCGAGIVDALAAITAANGYQPGALADSPLLAAAQSVPVTVGASTPFGCSVTTSSENDWLWLLLVAGSLFVVSRKCLQITP